MKKKTLSLLLVAAMTASMAAGCGGNAGATANAGANAGTNADADAAATDTSDAAAEPDASADESTTGYALDKSWPEETIKIAVETFDPTDDQFLAVKGYCEYLKEYYNVDFMYSEAIASAEDEIAFIDSAAAAGCKGLYAMYNVSGEAQGQECIDNEMYFWGQEDYYDTYKDSEYYAGTYTFKAAGDAAAENGDFIGGYQMGYNLATQGATHAFYCNGGASMGIGMFVDRQAGFEAGIAAAVAEGYECAYDPATDVVEGWPGTDDFTAAVTAKITDSSYDAVGVSFTAAALFQPIYESGRDSEIKVATIGGVNDTYVDAANSGLVSVIVYDCEEVVFMSAIPMLLNAINGDLDMTRGADGSAGKVFVNRWTITDADAFNSIYNYHADGNYYVSAADLVNCIKALNPDATYDSMAELYGSLDLVSAIAK